MSDALYFHAESPYRSFLTLGRLNRISVSHESQSRRVLQMVAGRMLGPGPAQASGVRRVTSICAAMETRCAH